MTGHALLHNAATGPSRGRFYWAFASEARLGDHPVQILPHPPCRQA